MVLGGVRGYMRMESVGRLLRDVAFKLRSERQLWEAQEMIVSGRGRSCYKVLSGE